MQTQTKMQALGAIMQAYPACKLSKENLAAYVGNLNDIPDEVLSSAVYFIVKNCRYFPSVKEIRTACYLARYGDWIEGWEEIIANVGHGKPQFTSPLVCEIVGKDWDAYSNAGSEYEMSNLRRLFKDAFESRVSNFDWHAKHAKVQIVQGTQKQEQGKEGKPADIEILRAYMRGERWMLKKLPNMA